MGRWLESNRKQLCGTCRKPVEPGEPIWMKRKGFYLCELCGSMDEHAPEPEVGPIQLGVLKDLEQFPPEAADSAIAQAMLSFARQMDTSEVASRDQPAYFKELRQGQLQLRLLFPASPEADETELARSRRERRLMQTGDSDAPEF